MSEQLLIRTNGGPFPGTRVLVSPPATWPLPERLPDPELRGVYVKQSESQLPPMAADSHVMRGAEYEWEPTT